MRTARSSLDLSAAIALALAGLAAALIPLDPWARVVLLAPLALAVSGYALLAALLPAEELPPGERLVYSVALSLVATTLGGIAVQLVFDLDRTAWAILLAAVTIAAAALALRRRGRLEIPRSSAEEHRPRLALPGLLSSLAVGTALAIAVAAVAISSAGAKRERDGYEFTALWAQPAERAAGAGQAVAIGVDNHQGAPARYRLVVRQGASMLVKRKLVLADGGRFRFRLPASAISPADPVTVSLHRNGEVFRHVYLESATP
ncbi:MAG: DUF1616 domain-containing protein [Solirubrobacterales bacterium]